MKVKLELTVDKFLRKYDKPFTIGEFCTIFGIFGQKISKEEASDFLMSDDRVFPLEKGYFITKAAVFTGMFFSFVLTRQEIEQGVFIPGDRCVPFVDGEFLSCHLNFVYNSKKLNYSLFETDCVTARSFFSLYGDEYISQYIASDPANISSEIANNDFELPPKVKLTGINIKKLIEEFKLKKGDRILCRVVDWDKEIIDIKPLPTRNKTTVELSEDIESKKHWNSLLEEALLKSFDKMGPCNSIEQQLSFVFYDNRFKLCTEDCGSIHECLKAAKKVDFEIFGVETRLWKKGSNVPAVGKWNKDFIVPGVNEGIPLFSFPEFVVDCMIKDQCFEKKCDLQSILCKILPATMSITEEQENTLRLQISDRNDILRENYNWFADYSIGSIRHKAIDLYTKIGNLVYEVDCSVSNLEKFPQQELVILSQLFSHISRILEMLAGNVDCKEDEINALSMSLEGMEYNFEDIRGALKAAIEKSFRDKLKIV